MRLLLDEMLSEQITGALDTFAQLHGDRVLHIVEIAGHGTPDDDIPGLCEREGIDALVSINVRDFGARKRYFEALLDSGIDVIIIRAPRQNFDVGQQAGFLLNNWSAIKRVLPAAEPTLVRVSQGGAAVRTLEQLHQELTKGRALP